jgi:DNA-binding CsgD family transcriptional regulator
VGRDQQLGRLGKGLQQARAGLPASVLLRGEAGAGKTRLLREFLAGARDGGATTLTGTCVEVSAGDLPFVPFRTALRHLVQGRPDIESVLGSAWRDLHVLLPELAPPTYNDRIAPPHVFEVVAAVVSTLCRAQAVVLAVDDAQWADQSTLQLLHYLLQSAQPQALLVVVAYRGEELPADPARQKAFEELSRVADEVVTVHPLDPEHVTELVRDLGAELSQSSMARLQARAGGLPFLVEELVAAERDGITRGIPRRVRDVIRLRLGALPPDAQLVVATVAVAARPLRHRVLGDAVGLSTRRFADALDAALTAHLLVADTDERTYAFRHDVAREIVHDDILTASRLELHVRLAAALQADLPVDAYATVLCEVAHHWLQSEANEEHALRAALLAARSSTRAFAHPEALRQYEHVLDLWPAVHDPELIAGAALAAVRTEAAEAAHWAGDTQSALRHVDEAIRQDEDLAADSRALLRERRAHYAWLDSGRLTSDPEQFSSTGSLALGARLRASDLMQRGRFAESVDHARTAAGLAHGAGSRDEEVRSRIILGVGLAMSDHLAEGRALLYESLADAANLQQTELLVAAHINLTFVLLAHGDLEEAVRIALAGMAQIRLHGITGSDGALVAVNAAEALTRLGRLAEAEQVLVNALDATLPPAVESVLLLGRAEVEVLSARHDQAGSTLRTVADLAPLEDQVFQQQLRAWEAELQLWDPGGGHTVQLPDLREAPGSAVVGPDSEDLPLTTRLIWLGARADADAVARSSDGDDARRQVLVEDLTALAIRGRRLAAATAATTDGMHRQLVGLLALVEAEESRLMEPPQADPWRRASARNVDDPYLRGYALWRLGCVLRGARRRRAATEALREAYAVAAPLGIQVLVDAVQLAGRSLDVRVDEPARARAPRMRTTRPYNLTAKESEVLALLVQGYTNRRIGSALRMSEKTASVHVSRILAKLSVSSRGEAVARAYELGLATVPTGR